MHTIVTLENVMQTGAASGPGLTQVVYGNVISSPCSTRSVERASPPERETFTQRRGTGTAAEQYRLYRLALKYALDRTVAAIMLVLLAPLLLAIALAIWIDTPGPVLFSQKRDGQNGRVFVIRKFRTMRWEGAGNDGRIQTLRCDRRVTRVGGFLRRTSLDELPQFWNVLAGTMSLVGPRPHPIAMRTEGRLCQDITPAYAERHRARPGMTGLAQINGHRGATVTADQVRARLADDLRYIETWSLLLDLQIILLTPDAPRRPQRKCVLNMSRRTALMMMGSAAPGHAKVTCTGIWRWSAAFAERSPQLGEDARPIQRLPVSSSPAAVGGVARLNSPRRSGCATAARATPTSSPHPPLTRQSSPSIAACWRPTWAGTASPRYRTWTSPAGKTRTSRSRGSMACG